MKRKLLTFIILLATVFGIVAVSNINTKEVEALKGGERVYFTPNDLWKADNAWFAAVFVGSGWSNETWVKLEAVTDTGETDLYSCVVPSNFTVTQIEFERMNPASTALGWSNKWTSSKTNIQSTKNYYTINSGSWSAGTWSVYERPAVRVNNLVDSYYNGGTYTKETNIYLNQTAVDKLNQNGGFHQTSELSRTTYYKPTELWMSKTTSNGETKYSYYGTATNGDLTSATTSEPLVTPSNPGTAATKSHSNWHNTEDDGMEGFYVTLKDIIADDSHKWKVVDGGYESTSTTVIEWFKAFCAPCYLGFNTGTGNYIDLVKVRVEEKNELLSLKLYAHANNYGLLSKHDDNPTTPDVFASAGVYLGERTKTYTVSGAKSTSDNTQVYAWVWGTIDGGSFAPVTTSSSNHQFVAPKGLDNAHIIRYNSKYPEDVKTWDKSVIVERADDVLTSNKCTWYSIDKWGLVGIINGVADWDHDKRMVNDGDLWTITVTCVAGDKFKIRLNGAWEPENYGKDSVYKGEDWNLSAGTYKITFDSSTKKITVTPVTSK